MTTPSENPKKPDNTRPKPAPDDVAGRELVEVPPAGEVVNLADARRARGLDQNTDGATDDGADSGAAGDVAGLEEAEVLDGEVIDAPDEDGAGLVQRSGRVVAHRDGAARREVLPDWLTDRDAMVATVRWAAGYAGHVAAFHAVRLPLYVLRLAGRAPIGAGRITAAAFRWVADTDNVEVRRALLTSADPSAFLRVREEARMQARRRGIAVTLALVALVAAGAVVATSGEPVWQTATIAAALVALGLAGRNRQAKVTGTATVTAEVPPLTADLIRDALLSLGLGSMGTVKADPAALRFLSIARDGAGFRADIDLPPGATASEVMDRRSKLASGLRRPIGCVWPEGDPEAHEGRLVLYVGDKSLSASKPTPWPLARKGGSDIFQPVPLGVDQRGRRVDVELMYASGIVGAVPRMGKTFSLRLLCLAAALDPRVELHLYDLKGGADLDPLAKVAHAYRSGDDPDDLTHLMADLRGLVKEFRRRQRVLRSLPRDVVPEGKVTGQLASDKRLGLHPIFVALDETQVLFENADFGPEARQLVEDLVRRGPAVGIMVWLATQRPDARSIPTGISANATKRLCLRVMGQVENDMVLGTSMYKNGVRATMFGSKDLGIAYLAGEGDDPVIVRTSFVDGPAADTITDRAHAVRKAQGRLTGLAAGEDTPETDTGTILDHLLAVWPETDPEWPNGKVWSDDLAARLAGHLPDLYDAWTGAQVNAAVRPHDVRVVQVKHDGTNRRGIARADVVNALADDAPITAAEYRTHTTDPTGHDEHDEPAGHDENGED